MIDFHHREERVQNDHLENVEVIKERKKNTPKKIT